MELGCKVGVTQNTAWKGKLKLLKVIKERDEWTALQGPVQVNGAY